MSKEDCTLFWATYRGAFNEINPAFLPHDPIWCHLPTAYRPILHYQLETRNTMKVSHPLYVLADPLKTHKDKTNRENVLNRHWQACWLPKNTILSTHGNIKTDWPPPLQGWSNSLTFLDKGTISLTFTMCILRWFHKANSIIMCSKESDFCTGISYETS